MRNTRRRLGNRLIGCGLVHAVTRGGTRRPPGAVLRSGRTSARLYWVVPMGEALKPSLRQVIRFGAFEVDVEAGELRKQGLKTRLQEQPLQILLLLLARPGDVVTREDLRQQLWPADTFVDFEHSLNAAVKRLRDALGDSADNPRFIETLPRRGYRFLLPVEAPGRGGAAEPPALSGEPARLGGAPTDSDADHRRRAVPAPGCGRRDLVVVAPSTDS